MSDVSPDRVFADIHVLTNADWCPVGDPADLQVALDLGDLSRVTALEEAFVQGGKIYAARYVETWSGFEVLNVHVNVTMDGGEIWRHYRIRSVEEVLA